MKEQLLSELEEHSEMISLLLSDLKKHVAVQVSSTQMRLQAKEIAMAWFNKIKPMLEKVNLEAIPLGNLSDSFERLLQYSKKVSRTSSYIALLEPLSKRYVEDLMHVVEIKNFQIQSGCNIDPYLEGLLEDDKDYLLEAAKCAREDCIRASIIMGWCATINRIHQKIVNLGFTNFNQATSEMKSKSQGRYKRFTKEYNINSLSELREVFDTDLLWILEYLQLIDVNQHERLRHCFLLRNNCGHPGDAPITGENLYSFYSDVSQIILKNKAFNS